ncbi:MAG: DivIVA domain-containing protein [Natronincolaceae bacterium]|jgi:cell division initiation protein|nr:DivIVA domain-containing protein [Bacillota bacterium]NLK90140.1 DivIVA domain-containing protein [Clostridiales bacterium]
MITPLEIQNKEFRRGIRGYKEDEVDEFLDKIILDYEKLYKENLELKDNLEGMHHQLEQYREIEETLKKTLIMAQNAAEDVKANAHKESELIMQETDAKVKEIIIKANNEAENTRSEFENIKNQMQIFKTRFKALLQSQLDSIDKMCDDLEGEN